MKWLRLCLLIAASVVFAACNPLEKKPNAGIQVITSGVTSSVFLNDQHLNTTPLIERNIQPGEYTLRIVPDDSSFVPYETSVTLRRGLLTVVTWKPATRPELSGGVIYEMEPISQKDQSEVSFVTIPDGAIVKFADRDKVFSPSLIQDVSPGHHEFEITLPSYELQKHTINVIPGHRMIVRAKLAKVQPTEEGGSVTPTATDSATLEEDAGSSTPSASISEASASAAVRANTPTAQLAATASPSAQPTQVTITKTNFFLNGEEVLRVRDKGGPDGEGIGYAPVGESYPYLGEQSGWYQISFNRTPGWVSSQYSKLAY